MSLQRRELVKPILRNDFSALCDVNVPVTSLLFGNDLAKALKEARQVGNVGKNFQSKNGNDFGIARRKISVGRTGTTRTQEPKRNSRKHRQF